MRSTWPPLRLGTQSDWRPGDRRAVGHAWLDNFLMDRTRTERLAPLHDRIDYVLAHPITENLAHGTRPATPGVSVSTTAPDWIAFRHHSATRSP